MDGSLWLRWEGRDGTNEAPIALPTAVLERLARKFAGASNDWRSMQRLLCLAASLATPVAKLADEAMPVVTPNDLQLAWAYAMALEKKIPRAALTDRSKLTQFIQWAEPVESHKLLQFLVLFDPNSVEMMEAMVE